MNAYPNPNMNAYPNTNMNAYPNAYSNPSINAYPNSSTNVYPNPSTNTYPNSSMNAYPNPSTNVYSNPNMNTYPNSSTNAYSNPNMNAYPYQSNQYAYPNPNMNAYPNPNMGAYPNPNMNAYPYQSNQYAYKSDPNSYYEKVNSTPPKNYPQRNSPYFIPGQWFIINSSSINVGLGWDFNNNQTFDLDASITAIDQYNNPVESVNYKRRNGLKGAIHHFGDNTSGAGEGDDEIISVDFESVPNNILSLAITINSYNNNSISRAQRAYVRLFDPISKKEIGIFELFQIKDCTGLLLGLLERNTNDSRWLFRVMCDPLEGTSINDSYPSLKLVLNKYLESFNTYSKFLGQRHPFPSEPILEPGALIKLDYVDKVNVGLGWDIIPGNIIDLDNSIVTFDSQNNLLEIVYHKHLISSDRSIIHYGDNRLGIGEGDNEIISVNLRLINQDVASLAVIVNSFKGNSMIGVKSGYIRLFDEKNLIGCHTLGQGTEVTGLLLGIFRRNYNNNSWSFQIFVSPIPGREPHESIEELKIVLNQNKLPM